MKNHKTLRCFTYFVLYKRIKSFVSKQNRAANSMSRRIPHLRSNDYNSYKFPPQRHRTSPPSPVRSPPPGGGASNMWYRLWRTHLQQSSPHLYSPSSKSAPAAPTNNWRSSQPPDRRTLSAGTVFRVG